jgi:VanZ family protein
MLLIWALSSIPTQFDFSRVPFRDKGVHCVEYATLAVLLTHALLGTFTRARVFVVFGAAALGTISWGAIDEIHQAFVPGRVSDVYDLMADSIGAITGAGLYLLVRRLRPTRP